MQEHAARLDRLTGELIGLARATDGNEHLISESSTAVILEGLMAGLPDSGCDTAGLDRLIGRVEEEKRKMVPNCFQCASPCGRTSAFDMKDLQNAQEDVHALKRTLLLGIRALAPYAHRARASGRPEEEAERFFYTALIVVGMDCLSSKDLMPIVQELDKLRTKLTGC